MVWTDGFLSVGLAVLPRKNIQAVDETIQLFVSGRSGQVTDVMLDGVGALCGIAVLMGVRKIYFHLKTVNSI